MAVAALVYPHQLFRPHPATPGVGLVFLVEEPLLFTQYRFHRQKLMLHRASMQRFAAELRGAGVEVRYVEAGELADTGAIAERLQAAGVRQARVVDPCDDWLARRLAAGCARCGVALETLPDPHFLTPLDELTGFAAGRERLLAADFYIRQRKRLGVLLEPGGKPRGGKWSFDPENRRRLPKQMVPPEPDWPAEDEFVREARAYVRRAFPQALGADAPFRWPTGPAAAHAGLADFVTRRLPQFGDYEDALSVRHATVFHSALTPALNIGLLSPQEVVDAALAAADRVPLNSLEGFVRQVIGWREFVRLVYLTRGREQRTRNFWGLTRPVPKSFYDGTTGIAPVDHAIRQALATGYCHHIERLMVLGNFMLLCDLAPTGVCQWFMEMFVDAYDWVMVPNVHGMSQHADGGMMTTKPYVSGSAYLRKMGDHPKGSWEAIWDGLYWRFIDTHAEFFRANPRMSMMAALRDKLGPKLVAHRRVAEDFLDQLHGG